MADKEASVYIVDVARSMSKIHQGREVSDLDWALQYVWEKITSTVATGRKTLHIGVLGLGTDQTDNRMSDDAAYKHISVLQPIAQILMPDLRRLPTLLKPSNTDNRDALSAVIIGVDLIMKHCKHLKYVKKLVLITNGTGHIDADDLESTADMIKQSGIELVVLGIDFDDPEYGFKEEDKPFNKAENEETLRKLVESCDGTFGTMLEAIDSLSRPTVKQTRPTPTFRGILSLGGPNYDTTLRVDIERYFKTSIRRAPTASSFAVQLGGPLTGAGASSDHLGAVYQEFSYTIPDPNATDGVKHIDRDDLAKGYEYGRTAVAISETDENITKLLTEASYEIMGFVPSENVERYMLIDNSCMVVSQKGNDKAAIALSSLIHGLYELSSVAIARVVKKDGAEPALTMLSPHVDADFECLIENVLPFAEDIRLYRFPPVDKVLTVSGKALTSHRNLPDKKLMQSMNDFVDSMSLTQPTDADDDEMDLDGQGKGEEMMPMDDMFSPVLHTIESAVRFRAVHPDKAIPPKSEAFMAYAKQPEEVRQRAKPALERLIEAADVKKVPAKVKGRKRYRDREENRPISGLDVESLFEDEEGREARKRKIDPQNAIPEFKRILDQSETQEQIKDALSQMRSIIEDLVKNSFGNKNYAQAIETMGVCREAMVEFEMEGLYTELVRSIKSKVEEEELGGNRREFWYQVRKSRLGLIEKTEGDGGGVGKQKAEQFWILK